MNKNLTSNSLTFALFRKVALQGLEEALHNEWPDQPTPRQCEAAPPQHTLTAGQGEPSEVCPDVHSGQCHPAARATKGMPAAAALLHHQDGWCLIIGSLYPQAVWQQYEAACVAEGLRAASYRTFCQLWRENLAHITVMKPMTDLCSVYPQPS